MEALVVDILSNTPELNSHRMNGETDNKVYIKDDGSEAVFDKNKQASDHSGEQGFLQLLSPHQKTPWPLPQRHSTLAQDGERQKRLNHPATAQGSFPIGPRSRTRAIFFRSKSENQSHRSHSPQPRRSKTRTPTHGGLSSETTRERLPALSKRHPPHSSGSRCPCQSVGSSISLAYCPRNLAHAI